jgi:site-specific recombinase XerD
MVTVLKTDTRLTLRNLIGDFLLSRQHLQPATLRFYRNYLHNFEWYAQTNDWPREAGDITRDHIRAFLSYVSTERNRWGYTDISRSSSRYASPATVHHYGRVVKILFNWAWYEEYLDHNPTLRLKLGSPNYKEIDPYTDQDVYAMFSLCGDDARFHGGYIGTRNKAIISLFVATGLRLSELAEIRLSELDPGLKQVRIMGKGAKMRVLPIGGEARKALKHYLEIRTRSGDELWKNADGLELTVRGIQMVVKRLKERAKVEGGGGPHRFRHYFATRYLENGGDLNTLRLLLGHATLNMVLKYSRHIDIQKALAGHQQFNPLDRLLKGDNHNRGDDGWGYRY